MRLTAFIVGSIVLCSCGGSFTSEPSGAGGTSGASGADASAGASGAGGASTTSATVGTTTSATVGTTTSATVGTTTGNAGAAGATGSGSGGSSGGAAGRGGSSGAAGSSVDAGRDTGTSDGGETSCKIDSDCKLVDDCCLGCIAKGSDFPVPPCDRMCLQDPCNAKQVKGVRCFHGSCALAAECDPSVVICKSLPPPCPAGQVPSISGSCWSGECVDAASCRTVKDCTACDPQRHVCARTEAQIAVQIRCVEVPPACATNRTCACLGPYACVRPSNTCAPGGMNELQCSCPVCL